MNTSKIENVFRKICNNKDPRIVLLRVPEVIMWIYGDTTFLHEKTSEAENRWGRAVLKIRRPDLTLDKQWTNKFGEHICEEVQILKGSTFSKPDKKEHMCPDLETPDSIIEVKTCTYFTTGTANEKILGTPFKYANVPVLYGKPLQIVCIGGAEKQCIESYGNLEGSDKCTGNKILLLEFFKSIKIEYIGLTTVLNSL